MKAEVYFYIKLEKGIIFVDYQTMCQMRRVRSSNLLLLPCKTADERMYKRGNPCSCLEQVFLALIKIHGIMFIDCVID